MVKGHLKRQVCRLPIARTFIPKTNYDLDEPIKLTLDEYECIRLIDYEKLTQLQCSCQMQLSRTSVQSLYASARKKLGKMLVMGMPLTIVVPDYVSCQAQREDCEVRHQEGHHCRHCLKESLPGTVTFVVVVANDNITHLLDPDAILVALTYQDGTLIQETQLKQLTEIPFECLVVSSITNVTRTLLLELGATYRLKNQTLTQFKEDANNEIL